MDTAVALGRPPNEWQMHSLDVATAPRPLARRHDARCGGPIYALAQRLVQVPFGPPVGGVGRKGA